MFEPLSIIPAKTADTPADAPSWASAQPSEEAIGVIRNHRSRRNQGRGGMTRIVSPGVIETTPEDHAELADALRLFRRRGVSLIVVDGGDGTMRDVLTAAIEIFGDDMPRLAIVPSGKTNALAADLGMPDDWSVAHAIEAASAGRVIERAPIEITRAGAALPELRGFLLGAGGFVQATALAQKTHRWGFFNGIAVVLSLLLAIAQTLFGTRGNPWRRGERMRIATRAGARDGAFYLALASTLERFPMALKPFGRNREGLKMIAVDAPPRSLLTMLFAMFTGSEAKWTGRAGYHRHFDRRVKMDVSSGFVLDGEVYGGGAFTISQGVPLRFVTP